jgi:hypothetical protein
MIRDSGIPIYEGRTANGVTQLTIPLIKLNYWLSWSGFDIDERPPTILV